MSTTSKPLPVTPHAKAIEWTRALILDLKLQLVGRRPHDPITFERLDEWHHVHAPDLMSCAPTPAPMPEPRQCKTQATLPTRGLRYPSPLSPPSHS